MSAENTRLKQTRHGRVADARNVSSKVNMQYITEYNSEWPQRFTQIFEYLTPFLAGNVVVHHIGSTSIPEMPAKDVIDMDIEYGRGSIQTVIDGLVNAGYEHEGDLGISGREAFKPVQGSKAASLPPHHLYACESGAHELLKHLAYRDYLVAYPVRRKWLATQKIAVDASAESRDSYIQNKSHYYSVISSESLEWANKLLASGPASGR